MDEGIQYLGVYITGDRNTKPMEDHLLEKALQYTSAFKKNHEPPGSRHSVSVMFPTGPHIPYPSLLATGPLL